MGILHAHAQETYHLPEHNYVPPGTSQHPQPLYTPNCLSNQYSQHPSYRSHTNRHDTLGYPYPRNSTYTSPSRGPPFSSTDQTDRKYQARRSNIPCQNNNYGNVIQNHALKDRQCLVSGTLDHKPITILTDTGSSINLLDEQLYCSLSFVPPLQPIKFSVSGADDRPLIALGITSLPITIDDNTFQVQFVVTRNILFPVVLRINFLQTHGGIISFPTNQLYLTTSSPKPAHQLLNTNRIYNTYTPPIHISNNLALGFCDPLTPKNTSLIQTATYARCHLAMNASERPHPLQNPNTIP